MLQLAADQAVIGCHSTVSIPCSSRSDAASPRSRRPREQDGRRAWLSDTEGLCTKAQSGVTEPWAAAQEEGYQAALACDGEHHSSAFSAVRQPASLHV